MERFDKLYFMSVDDLRAVIEKAEGVINYIMEHHGYTVMDLVDEIRCDLNEAKFMLDCKLAE